MDADKNDLLGQVWALIEKILNWLKELFTGKDSDSDTTTAGQA